MKFEDVLKSENYLILGTADNGWDNNAEVCQIAIINAAGETLLNTYVKPMRPILRRAIALHGITDETVADAPWWPELADQVAAIYSGQNLIIYDAWHKLDMIGQNAAMWGLGLKCDFYNYCARLCPAQFQGESMWRPLAKAAAYYATQTTGAHDALADCLTTLAVCKGMAQG